MASRTLHGFYAIGAFLLLLAVLAPLIWFYVWLEERFDEEAVHSITAIVVVLVLLFLLGYFWQDLAKLHLP